VLIWNLIGGLDIARKNSFFSNERSWSNVKQMKKQRNIPQLFSMLQKIFLN